MTNSSAKFSVIFNLLLVGIAKSCAGVALSFALTYYALTAFKLA